MHRRSIHHLEMAVKTGGKKKVLFTAGQPVKNRREGSTVSQLRVGQPRLQIDCTETTNVWKLCTGHVVYGVIG